MQNQEETAEVLINGNYLFLEPKYTHILEIIRKMDAQEKASI
jgi:hypothetical protein